MGGATVWECENCSKEFDTKKQAESHERLCGAEGTIIVLVIIAGIVVLAYMGILTTEKLARWTPAIIGGAFGFYHGLKKWG